MPKTHHFSQTIHTAIAGVLTNGPFLGPRHIHMHITQIQKAIDTVTVAV